MQLCHCCLDRRRTHCFAVSAPAKHVVRAPAHLSALLYCAFRRGQIVQPLLVVFFCACLAACGQQGPLRPADSDDTTSGA